MQQGRSILTCLGFNTYKLTVNAADEVRYATVTVARTNGHDVVDIVPLKYGLDLGLDFGFGGCHAPDDTTRVYFVNT